MIQVALLLVGQYAFPPVSVNVPGNSTLGRQVINYYTGINTGRPKVINLAPITVLGRVTKIDEVKHLVTVRTYVETINVHYGRDTVWRSLEDGFRELTIGDVIDVNIADRTITIVGSNVKPRQTAARRPRRYRSTYRQDGTRIPPDGLESE